MIKNILNEPLVTIMVISFNSSNYILDTLSSVYEQTYANIELIICDDCSTDGTIDICNSWLQKFNQRFVRVVVTALNENSGISANCNQGLKLAAGEWIKTVAGDDILLPDCIDMYMNYVFSIKKIGIEAIFAQQQSFSNLSTLYDSKIVRPVDLQHSFYNDDSTARDQHQALLYQEILIPGPTTYLKRELLNRFGGYDEKYRLLEDYPLFLKLTESNIKIYFLCKVTVLYRVGIDSVSSSSTNKILSNYRKDWNKLLIGYNFGRVSNIEKINICWHVFIDSLIFKLGNRGLLLSFLLKFSYKIQPRRILGIKKRLLQLFNYD